MKKYTLLILLALLLPAATMAQKKEKTGFIVGQVKNALNHTVIDGARVTLMSTGSIRPWTCPPTSSRQRWMAISPPT